MSNFCDYNSINDYVSELLNKEFDGLFDAGEDITVKASLYSLCAGGKRIRPALFMTVSKMLSVDENFAIKFACALEMIHTYSLIHDDLPCMDDDDLRRGRPTCHKAYGENFAVLAGDCLLNRAYEILFDVCKENPSFITAASYIADRAGINGMVGGQSIDLFSEGKEISLERLKELQAKKTGALLQAAIVTPAFMSSDKNDIVIKLLDRLSCSLGLAFQIRDDLLDVTSNAETLGKSIGKDERDNKSTFVTCLGFDKASEFFENEMKSAYNTLDEIKNLPEGYDVSELRVITDFLMKRDR